ncbi:peptidase inhibitor R3HDML [Loxodonta africana]|uniref:peptidase inhibitor R3HDML n=1 Tax=Loxodonta africana TaxID=9785 RepID=UPI0002234A28|nr:peptidase inhibitor R3HDML [Loxodonta africana]XP_049724678.1 peptidase inhibitor R3HDML [Elephas maximus indicus]
MPLLPSILCLAGLLFRADQTASTTMMPNATLELAQPKVTAVRSLTGLGVPRYHRKRHISARDMSALLDYHNHLRASVYPPAANMEYMVWDEQLARSAEAWATQCIWAHGPSQLMRYVGQNLSIHSGRYRSVVDLVKSWSEEKRHYLFPAPRDCNPHCPWRCSGPVCSHYTQMVWASSNRLGCAIHTCGSINVWGSNWRRAVYLVCNYAIKGNWIGEAPYKMGKPCSACPSSYQGSCSSNMCFSGLESNRLLWF